MEFGMQTSMDHFAAYSFIAMEDCDENQTCEWYKSRPKMMEALNGVFRIKNDINTFEVIDTYKSMTISDHIINRFCLTH